MGKATTLLKSQGSPFGKDKSRQVAKSVRNKNISKREFDKVRKAKQGARIERVKERKANRERELALKKAEKRMKKGGKIKSQEKKDQDEEEWEEVDEHEKDVFDKDGYFDVPDAQTQISVNDEKLLKTMQKRREETGKSKPKENETVNLADLIMQKLASGQFTDGNAPKAPLKYEELEDGVVSTLDPKVVAAYKSLGSVLKQYKSGKLPKIFKIIPQIANWEEVLFLTKPSEWSPQSTAEATKIFVSNLNGRMV
jgi:essential nuclear protein 1